MPRDTKDRRILPFVVLPLIFLGVFGSLFLLWEVLDLPPEQELMARARGYFESYGLVTVFVAGLIEGLLLIGWYFPGALVILAALTLSADNAWEAAQIIALTIGGLSIAYTANYFVGKYGWYRLLVAFGLREGLDRAKGRLTKYGLSAIVTTYWQMNLASLTSTAAGILHFPAGRFLAISIVACAFWVTFWGTMMFLLGQAATAFVSLRVIVAVIAVWLVARLLINRFRR
jgi:membrane protein DedA with SNARE-associated domain